MSLAFAPHRRLIGAYLHPLRGRAFLLAALIVTDIALRLVSPQVIRFFIDTAQSGGALRLLMLAALAYLGVGLLGRVLGLAGAYVGLDVAWRATNRLRGDLSAHLLRLDMPFHKAHTPGELIERVDGDVSELAELFGEMLVKIAGNALLVVAILLLLYRENTCAGMALTAYTLITAVALVFVNRIGVRAWAAARQSWADMLGYLEERLEGIEDIRGVGAERHVLRRFHILTEQLLVTARGGWMANALGIAMTDFLFVVGYAMGLAIGATLYLRGEVSIGAAFLIVYYIGMLAAPLQEIREQATSLQSATAGVDRVTELLALAPEVADRPAAPGTSLVEGPLGLTFEHVSFHYDDLARGGARVDPGAVQEETDDGEDRLRVLRDITFAIAPGRVVGVLGRTGSGKTTLTRLLFRLYDPQSGTISLSGTEIRGIPLETLRRRVAMVTQDVQLWGASVRDNVTLFDADIGDAQVQAALVELGLWDWIAAMPGGLDHRLSPGGASMSAGEAQLLAFTRLLLRDPGLIILDEAASRLDVVTERRLEAAVDRLLVDGRRTALIIAHRMHTVQRADDILILEDGGVAEFGPRSLLAANPGSRFASLLRTGLEEALR